MNSALLTLRQEYHHRVGTEIVRVRGRGKGAYPNFADKSSVSSRAIAWKMVELLGFARSSEPMAGQRAGSAFERITKDYLEEAFRLVDHLRPGEWEYGTQDAISGFAQYEHLAELGRLVKGIEALAASLGTDYIVKPDIIISRQPVSDAKINESQQVIAPDDPISRHTLLREANSQAPLPLLHASISCKWTLRSDRSQNARAEALNLIRNRKGHLPHIAAVTAEPLPTRIASLALGTGDLDCVYHFALPELEAAVEACHNEDQLDMLRTLVDGKRLRDISDLPFDLAV